MVEGSSEHPIAVVTGDTGVERRGRAPAVSNLLLHEERIEALLDQMGDVGVAQAVGMKGGVEAELVAVLSELESDVIARDA